METRASKERGTEHRYGWLGAVIPADAKRFRVRDAALADVLADSGAQLVTTSPDVEIAPVDELAPDAALSIAVLGATPASRRSLPFRGGRLERPLPWRVATRIVRSLRVRLSARRARRVIRGLGHAEVEAWLWDHQMTAGTGRASASLRSWLRGVFPQRAIVLGRRSHGRPSVLDDVLVEAGRATGRKLTHTPPLVRTGVLIVETDQGILRVALGPDRAQIVNQRGALSFLRMRSLSPVVKDRVPWQLAGGTCGLAEWSLEKRLPGTRPAHRLTSLILFDCVDFLAALHAASSMDPVEGTFLEQAALVQAARPSQGARIRDLGERLETALADLPRAFVHGDFFPGNLLVDRGRLVGVVDWDAAGPGRVPLVDVLHLQLTSTSEMADADWGPLLVRRLLPFARAGGSAPLRAYSKLTGLDLNARRLEMLVFAYWLDYVSYQIRTRRYLGEDAAWLERTIDLVLREFRRPDG